MAQAYQRPLIEANEEANFFEYIIMLEIFPIWLNSLTMGKLGSGWINKHPNKRK